MPQHCFSSGLLERSQASPGLSLPSRPQLSLRGPYLPPCVHGRSKGESECMAIQLGARKCPHLAGHAGRALLSNDDSRTAAIFDARNTSKCTPTIFIKIPYYICTTLTLNKSWRTKRFIILSQHLSTRDASANSRGRWGYRQP